MIFFRVTSVVRLCLAFLAMLATSGIKAEEKEPSSTSSKSPDFTAVDGLREFTGLVGNWRGVGQIKRNSNQGAWQEQAEVLWELKSKSTGLRWKLENGKEWKSAILSFDPKSKSFVLTATLPDDSERIYTGKKDENRLVLETADPKKEIHRVTLTSLNENRVLLLFERRSENQSFYSRVGEVAYQRQGTKLAAVGGTGPICVVTGGTGTIAVTHNGKTYYVCCTGCRDAFNDDPAGILAAYEKKKSNPEK